MKLIMVIIFPCNTILIQDGITIFRDLIKYISAKYSKIQGNNTKNQYTIVQINSVSALNVFVD